ncbi:signal peptidase II [Phenylobacterium sp. J426]|uniref:signal peptidase II n=1 Tax=Phenylobacterium sp. J426 TaxID=2898439 RepID=UPI002151F1EA|nr:signal peptidase II [Phenylobacterium sp. J426]MCR5874310.1 signal peptidase II [Phenylobacterium sp. J426]
MSRITRHGWAAYGLALVLIVLDQITKLWALTLPEQVPHEVVWPLQITRIWNNGVSFGLFQAGNDIVRWGFVVFSVAVAVLLALWARRAGRWLPAVGLSLVMAGAIGNAIDRARFGAVVDFIDVSRIGVFPWIFNIADSGITIGVVLLLLDSLRKEQPAQEGPGAASA